MGIYLPGARTVGYVIWPGAGNAYSQGILPDFYPPPVNVGLPVSLLLQPLHATMCLLASPPVATSPPLLPMNECGFFKSLVVRLPYNSIF